MNKDKHFKLALAMLDDIIERTKNEEASTCEAMEKQELKLIRLSDIRRHLTPHNTEQIQVIMRHYSELQAAEQLAEP